MRHVFGPVPSRRLGFSLGVDPVVPKTCTMDCVYCELGRTTDRTVCRRRYVDPEEIKRELRERLSERPGLDHVTFSGSGEPTLSADLGDLIEYARDRTSVPVAVLTNGSLVGDPEVRSALRKASVVVPSLDAVSPEAFERVNRPHPSLDPSEIVEALARFAADFRGRLWLETLIVADMNDAPSEVALISRAVERIQPDRVQLGTVVRPPAEAEAGPVTRERLLEIATALGPRTEVIAPPSGPSQERAGGETVDRITEMASRRPVTAGDVARVIGMSQAESAKILDALVREKRLELVRLGERLYYKAYLDREQS
ncbi:MAG: radical SAM protein [Candidatus Eisenbacteria bacterium]|nr:radical SAM protein [Candidatus Eisenbacteria bacterium]